MNHSNSFNRFLLNTLFAGISSNTIWFALVFWVYLEIQSLTVSSIVAAIFPITSSILGIFFGVIVDSRSKKTSMVISSALSFGAFLLAGLIFASTTPESLLQITNPVLWIWVTLILSGAVANNLRMITLSTLVTELVDEDNHAKANGRIGVVNGVSFALTSVISGILIGTLGMGLTLLVTVVTSVLILLDCVMIPYHPKYINREEKNEQKESPLQAMRGGLAYMIAIPGLFALVLFTTYNNFLGGVFMALLDPYGLELVSVEVWGMIWGALSFIYIIGGWIVARKGLGKLPLKTLMIANFIMWFATIIFPIYSNIYTTIIGCAVYMILSPFIEAAEQTIIQRVVEPSKQGRVFGTAQSIEMLASPVTSIAVGPLTQLVIQPNIEMGIGYDLVGSWFGSDIVRGMAFVFIISGIFGVLATFLAMRSHAYAHLNQKYQEYDQPKTV